MKVMSCQFVRESISGYVDDRLAGSDRQSIAEHLESCGECAAFYGQTGRLRESLRALPAVPAPEKLGIDLRIIASKELVRQRQSTWAAFWQGRVRLIVDNLM